MTAYKNSNNLNIFISNPEQYLQLRSTVFFNLITTFVCHYLFYYMNLVGTIISLSLE